MALLCVIALGAFLSCSLQNNGEFEINSFSNVILCHIFSFEIALTITDNLNDSRFSREL